VAAGRGRPVDAGPLSWRRATTTSSTATAATPRAETAKVDATWALVWHLDVAGKVDRVVNRFGDQHQMDAFTWTNLPLKPLPERLVG
jgi:hypothetical protein